MPIAASMILVLAYLQPDPITAIQIYVLCLQLGAYTKIYVMKLYPYSVIVCIFTLHSMALTPR